MSQSGELRPFPAEEERFEREGVKLKSIARRPGFQLDPKYQFATVPNHTSQCMVTVVYEDEDEEEGQRAPVTSSKLVEASERHRAIEELALRVVEKVRARSPRYR